jgi:hypothetical protein
VTSLMQMFCYLESFTGGITCGRKRRIIDCGQKDLGHQRVSLCPAKRGNPVTLTITLSVSDGVLEMLPFPQVVQKLPAFEKTRIFVAMATTAYHLSLS